MDVIEFIFLVKFILQDLRRAIEWLAIDYELAEIVEIILQSSHLKS